MGSIVCMESVPVAVLGSITGIHLEGLVLRIDGRDDALNPSKVLERDSRKVFFYHCMHTGIYYIKILVGKCSYGCVRYGVMEKY